MKTYIPKVDEVDRRWWLVDATDQTVGRMATKIANSLRGKDKVEFTPHMDNGDFVVVVNCNKIKFSGNKMDEKKYYTHSRYFGSLKTFTAKELVQDDPEKIIIEAVKGMLPKNKLSRQLLKKLKVYAGTEHPHEAQKPQAMSLN